MPASSPTSIASSTWMTACWLRLRKSPSPCSRIDPPAAIGKQGELHMNRMLWPLGILLLVGSVVGAGWALNHTTPQAGADGKDEVKNAPPAVVVCLGLVDVEK